MNSQRSVCVKIVTKFFTFVSSSFFMLYKSNNSLHCSSLDFLYISVGIIVKEAERSLNFATSNDEIKFIFISLFFFFGDPTFDVDGC